MNTRRDLAWLRAKLAAKINFDVTQTHQDFAGPASDVNQPLDDILSEVYQEEINLVQKEVGPEPFLERTPLVWPVGVNTLTIPQTLLDRNIIRVDDETDTSPGLLVWLQSNQPGATIFWSDRQTLTWGTAGPSSARTLQFTYVAEAEEMNEARQEPVLIPYKHRWLLVWSAAVVWRMLADEKAPQMWYQRREELREQYHMLAARGLSGLPESPGIKNFDTQVYINSF